MFSRRRRQVQQRIAENNELKSKVAALKQQRTEYRTMNAGQDAKLIGVGTIAALFMTATLFAIEHLGGGEVMKCIGGLMYVPTAGVILAGILPRIKGLNHRIEAEIPLRDLRDKVKGELVHLARIYKCKHKMLTVSIALVLLDLLVFVTMVILLMI